MDEQHARRLLAEQPPRQRQRDETVVVDADGERERFPRAHILQPRHSRAQQRDDESQRDRPEAHERREHEVVEPAHGVVTEHFVEDQARREEIDVEPQQTAIGVLREPVEPTQDNARDRERDDWQDRVEDDEEFTHRRVSPPDWPAKCARKTSNSAA